MIRADHVRFSLACPQNSCDDSELRTKHSFSLIWKGVSFLFDVQNKGLYSRVDGPLGRVQDLEKFFSPMFFY